MSVNVKFNPIDDNTGHDGWLMRVMREENTSIVSRSDLPDAAIVRKTDKEKPVEHVGKLPRNAVLNLASQGLLRLVSTEPVERFVLADNSADHSQGKIKLVAKGAGGTEESATGRGGALMSPLELLSRKSDRLGKHYLDGRMLLAAQQLLEDYEVGELSQYFGENVCEDDWQSVLINLVKVQQNEAQAEARRRFGEVMLDLGHGLRDVVYCVCCLQQGLETAENNLGWSARSAKVVLRIALLRVADFYQIPESYKSRAR